MTNIIISLPGITAVLTRYQAETKSFGGRTNLDLRHLIDSKLDL